MQSDLADTNGFSTRSQSSKGSPMQRKEHRVQQQPRMTYMDLWQLGDDGIVRHGTSCEHSVGPKSE
jgi:hypothetical protein